MVGIISGVVGVILSILVAALLVVGMWYSWKNSLKLFFSFFLLLLLKNLYSLISPTLIQHFIDSITSQNKWPMDITIGELVALLSLIPKILEVAAFLLLIEGLRRMWMIKKAGI